MGVVTSFSPFGEIKTAPPDPILGIKQRFLPDSNPRKVDLSVGVYQDEKGRTDYLAVVQKAQLKLAAQDVQAGYLPIDGLPEFNRHVQRMLFGEAAEVISARRVVTVQAVGGTSALRYGADFLRRHMPGVSILVSDPTWENHKALFERAGLRTTAYPYYQPASGGLDLSGMLAALKQAPRRSVVLLHAACHNPTGVDPSPQQWDEIIDLLGRQELIPFLDFAYQGLGRGLDEDAAVVRKLAAAGFEFLVASSFSKNFSLYRRRTGALSVVVGDESTAGRVLSQLKTDIRANNSNSKPKTPV